MPVNAERVAALLSPIAPDAPAGKDLRYDPRYDKVKEARREDLELPPGGLASDRKLADWPQVIALGGDLLEKQTKDLQLSAWLTEAMLKRDGLGGLATGLSVLNGLLRDFWESVYPELDPDDLELRTGPLEWVGGRLDIAVRQSPVASGGITLLDHLVAQGIPNEDAAKESTEKRLQREEALSSGKRSPEDVARAVGETGKVYYKALLADLNAAESALDALETTSDERFGRDAPAFTKMRSALADVRLFVEPTLAEKLVLDPDPIEVVEEAAAAGGEGVAGDGTMSVEPKSVADAASRVAAAARYLRQQDATNPAPYLLLRGLRWGELRASVGDVDPKLLEAPPTVIRSRLKGLVLDGKWPDVLEQGEQLMATPQGRGWLDLQRYTLTACAQLGGSYDAVAAAVRTELGALLAALPGLSKMTLMDDTPTANDETRAWLDSEVLAPTNGSGDDDEPAADAELPDGADALDEAVAEEDATAANGGLRATRRARPGRPGAPRDVFEVARGELAHGRANRAIELLVAEIARERSPRGRFVRQTQVAFVMVEAGLDSVAYPILRRLVDTIEERGLEQWEAGPLVAQPLALMCRVIDRTEGDADERGELYRRVCRLDPMQALALGSRA